MAAAPGGSHAAWVMNLLTDLSFNLLIFFVVCASAAQEQKGRPQQVPSASEAKPGEAQTQNVEVAITRTTVSLNGAVVPVPELRAKLVPLLATKTRPEDKIVEVKTAKDTPYSVWIRVTGVIEEAGGVVTLQVEVDRDVIVK